MLKLKKSHDSAIADKRNMERTKLCSQTFQRRKRILSASSEAQTLLGSPARRPGATMKTKCPDRPFSSPADGRFLRKNRGGVQGYDSITSKAACSPTLMICGSPVSNGSTSTSPMLMSVRSSPSQGETAEARRCNFRNWNESTVDGRRNSTSPSASEVHGFRDHEDSNSGREISGVRQQKALHDFMAAQPPEKIEHLREEMLKSQCRILARDAIRTRRFLECGKALPC